jgi:hypothetical protein
MRINASKTDDVLNVKPVRDRTVRLEKGANLELQVISYKTFYEDSTELNGKSRLRSIYSKLGDKDIAASIMYKCAV